MEESAKKSFDTQEEAANDPEKIQEPAKYNESHGKAKSKATLAQLDFQNNLQTLSAMQFPS